MLYTYIEDVSLNLPINALFLFFALFNSKSIRNIKVYWNRVLSKYYKHRIWPAFGYLRISAKIEVYNKLLDLKVIYTEGKRLKSRCPFWYKHKNQPKLSGLSNEHICSMNQMTADLKISSYIKNDIYTSRLFQRSIERWN